MTRRGAIISPVLRGCSQVPRQFTRNGIELCFKAVVEHVADHGHAGRPLRRPAEVGMAEVGHGSATAAQGLKDRPHVGNAVFACKPGG